MIKNEKISIVLFIVVIILSFLSLIYLVENSQYSKNIAIVEEEFIDFTGEKIMISNISHIRGEEIASDMRDIDGVYSVAFNSSPAYYKDSSALFLISYEDEAIDEIKKVVEPYDVEEHENRIKNKFGRRNIIQLIIPCGNYQSEKQLLNSLSKYPQVDYAKGLSNIEGIGGYSLTDIISPDEFSQLMKLDYEISSQRLPLIHMVELLYNQAKEGHIRLDSKYLDDLEEYHSKLSKFKALMEGENYSRIFIKLDLPIEGEETAKFISRIYSEASLYYDLDSVFLLGESIKALER